MGVSPNARRIILLGLVLAGLGLRLGQYLSNRSYWQDEAYLVLNIFHKSAADLLGPLDARAAAPQAAPPLFLMAQRGLHAALGHSEWAMRAVPMLAGVLGLVLFAVLAWRVLAPAGAAMAVALFAFSDRLIWHASEAKQYSSDVLFAVLLWLAAFSGGSFIGLSLLAAVAIWMSHPVVFVYGGVSLAWASRMLRGERADAARWLLGNVLFGLSLLALYLLSIRVQEAEHFYDYWARELLPWTRPWTIPWWLIERTYNLFDYPFRHAGAVVMVLGLAGAVWWWRSGNRTLLAMLLLPVALVLLAAALHRYPYGARRLNLFLAPGLFLLAGAGLQRAWQQRIKVAMALAGLLVAVELAVGVYHLFVPRQQGHLRPAVSFLRTHRQSGDGVVVLSWEEFRCYWPQPDADIRSGWPPPHDSQQRFWLVWSYADRRRWLRGQAAALAWKQAHEWGDEQPGQSYIGSGGAAILFRRASR